MSGVPSHPFLWVGEYFRPDGGTLGRRLLIVADPRASEPGAVRQVGRAFEAAYTGEYISGEMKHLLWTQVARVVLGDALPREDCEHFWKCVAFTNPEPNSWAATVESLSPHVILVLGASLWNTLPGFTSEPPAPRLDGNAAAPGSGLGHFRLSNEALVPAAYTPHPGAPGYQFRDWAPLVARLLTDAGAP